MKRTNATLLILVFAPVIFSCNTQSTNAANEEEKAKDSTIFHANWRIMNEISYSPSMQVEYSMVYYKNMDKTIVYGGRSSDWKYINETWEFDHSNKTWVNLQPVNVPQWRHNAALAYDLKRKCIYMFGGSNLKVALNDLWKYDYDLNTWEKINNSMIEGRQMHGLEYIPDTDELIVFGGRKTNGGACYNDTWLYNIENNDWKQVNSKYSPAIQDHVTMTYVSSSQKIMLYEYLEGAASSKVWMFDPVDRQWSLITESNSVLCNHTYSNYVPSLDVSILFGPQHGTNQLQTWVFRHADNSWQNITPSKMPKGHIEHAGMAYSEKSGKFILYGGCCSEKTLELEVTKKQGL